MIRRFESYEQWVRRTEAEEKRRIEMEILKVSMIHDEAYNKCRNKIIDLMDSHKEDEYYEEEYRPFCEDRLRILENILFEKTKASNCYNEKDFLYTIGNHFIFDDYLFEFGGIGINPEPGCLTSYCMGNNNHNIYNRSSFEAIINACKFALYTCNYVTDSNGNISFYINVADIKNGDSTMNVTVYTVNDKFKGLIEEILTYENKLPENFDESKTDLHFELIPLDNDLCYLCTEIIYNGESLCKFRWKQSKQILDKDTEKLLIRCINEPILYMLKGFTQVCYYDEYYNEGLSQWRYKSYDYASINDIRYIILRQMSEREIDKLRYKYNDKSYEESYEEIEEEIYKICKETYKKERARFDVLIYWFINQDFLRIDYLTRSTKGNGFITLDVNLNKIEQYFEKYDFIG